MGKIPKKTLINLFLEKKNIEFKDLSFRQKQIFNDTPELWEYYDWEFNGKQ